MQERRLGPEAAASNEYRILTGFYNQYCQGKGLDIGYRGSVKDADPVLPNAVGIDLDYPGYNGLHLPFDDETQDYVWASHILEHVVNWQKTLQEWYRVLKVGGYMIICVPHKALYEKKSRPPSKWNGDHKRFYTPGSLLLEVEAALPMNKYRIRSLRDNDRDFDYTIPVDKHSGGCYEIELVVQKIEGPTWDLENG